VSFDEYLISKKIDGLAFQKAEPRLFQEWQLEFDQMHVNSFTVQKLNLINPIRRKYLLSGKPGAVEKQDPTPASAPTSTSAPARVSRPVFKPKIN
jgi:hypothetical protein